MFKYYNANPLGRHVSDCTVRAISLALDISWDTAFDMLSKYAKSQAITFSEIEFINDFLAERFPRYCDTDKIVQLKDFLNLRLSGTWLVTMSGHITCVIDGVCYDTFDPSEKYIWCIYHIK